MFVVGPPIAHPRRFFGRTAVVKGLFGLWKGLPLQNAAIIGPARSGKTSLLRHLLHLAASPPDALRPDQQGLLPAALRGHRWAFVDFQNPRLGEPEGFLRYLLPQLGISIPSPCTVDSLFAAVETGLQAPSVVLLDESGVALTDYPSLDRRFWNQVRALQADFGVAGRLGFVLASHESPHELSENHGKSSPFFNTFGFTERLGPFTEAEARQLAGSAPVPFPEEDMGWIVGRSRWPIKVQALCRERLAALEEKEEGDGWREKGLRQTEPWSFLPEGR